MKYLFDSPTIFRAKKENKIENQVGNYTLELARYELGNILWKNFALQTKATEQEIKTLAKIIKNLEHHGNRSFVDAYSGLLLLRH